MRLSLIILFFKYNLAKEILATDIFYFIYRCDGWNRGCSNSIWWKEFLLVLLRSYCCVVVCDDFGYDVGWELYLTTCSELRCWWCYHGRPCNNFNLCFLCRNDLMSMSNVKTFMNILSLKHKKPTHIYFLNMIFQLTWDWNCGAPAVIVGDVIWTELFGDSALRLICKKN